MTVSATRVAALYTAGTKGRFITDFGSTSTVSWDDGRKQEIPRYGVWGNMGHWTGKPEVMEVSDDLDALQKKYGPDLPVQRLA